MLPTDVYVLHRFAESSLFVGHGEAYTIETGVLYEYHVNFNSAKKSKTALRKKFPGAQVSNRNTS